MSASAPRPGTLSVKMISVEGMRRISAFFFGRGSRIIESAESVSIDSEIFLVRAEISSTSGVQLGALCLSSRTAQTERDLASGQRSRKLFCVIHHWCQALARARDDRVARDESPPP